MTLQGTILCLSVADRLFTKKWTAVSETVYRLKLATV